MQGDESLSDKLLSIRREHLASRKQVAIELGVVLALFYAPLLYAGFSVLFERFTPYSTPLKDSSQILSYLGRIGLILYLIWSRNEPLSKFGLTRLRVSDLFWSLGIYFVFLVALFSISSLEIFLIHLPGAYKPYSVSSEPALWLAPLTFLAAAFYQELVWRSYVFRRLQELELKSESAIFVCAALFATLHIGMGWTAIPSYFAVGVALGFFFSKYQRLWPLVLGHAAYNLVFLLLHSPSVIRAWGLPSG